jgi:Carboxypeptidase regulatory-like domain
MSRACVCLVAALSLAWAHQASAQAPSAQPARDRVVSPGSSAVTGRVTEAGSNQPVRNAHVHAASPALPGGRDTYTDGDGAYVFRDLPTGAYSIAVNKIGWVNTSFGQTRPRDAGRAIDVAAATTAEHIDIVMMRGGVIAGRITDEFGDPLPSTSVMAMRYQMMQGTRRLTPANSRQTNDLGEFRLFGLAPGQYFLTATRRNNQPGANDAGEVYAATYYPGTASVAGAQSLTIAQGQTMSGMNMMLLAVRPVRVSGTVTSASGQSLAGMPIIAGVRMGNGTMAPTAGPIGPDGSFTLNGLSAGDYILRVRAGNGEFGAMPLTVGSSDMTGVQMVTSPPTKVTGHVIVDPGELGTLKGSTFRLGTPAADADEASLAGGQGAQVKDDFTFELSVNPGHVFIRSNTNGWFLRSVKVRGLEILDTGVEVRPNEPIGGVEVVLTHRQPELGGVVKDAIGEPTRAAYVVVFAKDPARWTYLSRYVRIGRPNPLSKYRVLIPPGDYYATAVDFMEPGQETDPDFLERLRGHAVAFSLQDGDKKELDLSVLPAVQP